MNDFVFTPCHKKKFPIDIIIGCELLIGFIICIFVYLKY